MKYIFHVAMREFAENAKTKGYWIGLLLFPLMIWLGFSASKWLDKATPVRHVVVIDQSGDYEPVIEKALARDYAQQRMQALQAHARKYMKPEMTKDQKIDFEKIPGDLQGMMEGLLNDNPEILDQASTPAGWKLQLSQTKKVLVDDAPDFEDPTADFRRVELPDGIDKNSPPPDIASALRPYLLGDKMIEVDGEQKKLFAAVIIPKETRPKVLTDYLPGSDSADEIQYWSLNLTDNDFPNLIKRALNDEFRRKQYEQGFGKKSVKKIKGIAEAQLLFSLKNPKKKKGEEDVSFADVIRQWSPVALVYLLWIAIFTISQMLLNNTIEEKSNRIIEVLLSSVTAGELMIGKLLGIAAVGMTMIGTWLLSMVIMLDFMRGPEAKMVNAAFEVLTDGRGQLLLMFTVYFILGYLFYAGIFLAIGSICNTIKEAQNFMGPVTIILMVPLITMFFIPKDPNGTLATVLSWIPLYTPFVMLNRAAADPPMSDVIGTMILMVIATAAMLWLCGKIFRIGILRSGQPPKVMELLRWVRG